MTQFTKEENRRGIRNLLILLPGLLFISYLVYGIPAFVIAEWQPPLTVMQTIGLLVIIIVFYAIMIVRAVRRS